MIISHKLYIIFLLIIIGCSVNNNISESYNPEIRFDKAVALFNEEKFSKAKDEFIYIINNNPGSILSMKSQLYLAEAFFNLEEYDKASTEYNKYIFVSQNSEMIERARFFICKCYYNLSSSYNKDQEGSIVALDKLQYFLEQYPSSIYTIEGENMIKKIRDKLAKKELESGKLYLRIEEYDSGIVYFQSIIDNYYDTAHYDFAIINMVLAFVLSDRTEEAQSFLKEYKREFNNNNNYLKANEIINNKMNLIEYLNLLK